MAPEGALQLNKVTHRKETKDFVPEPPHKCRIPIINERDREKKGGGAREKGRRRERNILKRHVSTALVTWI